MTMIVFDFPAFSSLGDNIRKLLNATEGKITLKTFPDDETYLRVETDVKDRDVIINASLFHPNDWILSLFFLADSLTKQGARSIGLVAPYLSYMRQDKIFQTGEALTSATFAKLISMHFSYLVTVDPHLHRYKSLSEIYSIPAIALKAAPIIADWVENNIENPFFIGPDQESEQWVKEIARDAPYAVLTKVRHSDGHVDVSWPEIREIGSRTPVLADDIISSGATMLQAIDHLRLQSTTDPICIAIHPIFAGNSYQELQSAGAQAIITCNTIPHPSNHIDLAPLLVEGVKSLHSAEFLVY